MARKRNLPAEVRAVRMRDAYLGKKAVDRWNDATELVQSFVRGTDAPGVDKGQSERAQVGAALKSLVTVIVDEEVKRLNRQHEWNLGCTTDDELRKKDLSEHLQPLRDDLLLDYGEYGEILPGVDVIVYSKDNNAIICVLCCKVSLRDRLRQMLYWKFKLLEKPKTRHVPVCLITPDTDGELIANDSKGKKNYAIASTDLDATYVLRRDLSQTSKIKDFSCFENDLRSWLGGGGG